MADEKQVGSAAHETILEAIRARVVNMNVISLLADDTDCYAKGSPGDAYAKNKCSIDLAGTERVLPPFMSQVFSQGRE